MVKKRTYSYLFARIITELFLIVGGVLIGLTFQNFDRGNLIIGVILVSISVLSKLLLGEKES